MEEFRKIYDLAFPVLFKVACGITRNAEAAEDLCQVAFFRLYEKDMVFPTPEEAKYWLIRVVKNAALNYIKHKKREDKAYQKTFREEFRREENDESNLIKKELQAEIQEVLNKLPEHLRIVVVLKEYAEMNYEEIGRVLGISEGKVKIRIFRARQWLATLLQDGSNMKAEKAFEVTGRKSKKKIGFKIKSLSCSTQTSRN
jgi:RNA polymerase sigma-70 factor (ECF subfamily)